MRRAATAIVVTVIAVVLLVNFKARSPALGTAAVAPRQTAAATAAPAKAKAQAKKRTTSTPKRRSSATAHTATGQAMQTRYGVVQVAATTVGGRLTAVRTLTMTYDNGRSQEIDVQAEPLLHQEALQAHSANIAVISGATYTSDGYIQSLQSAIDRARNA
jgi:uncharacterized protein with FMN-binding domain